MEGCDQKLSWPTPEFNPNVHEGLRSPMSIELWSLVSTDAEEMVSTRPITAVSYLGRNISAPTPLIGGWFARQFLKVVAWTK